MLPTVFTVVDDPLIPSMVVRVDDICFFILQWESISLYVAREIAFTSAPVSTSALHLYVLFSLRTTIST